MRRRGERRKEKTARGRVWRPGKLGRSGAAPLHDRGFEKIVVNRAFWAILAGRNGWKPAGFGEVAAGWGGW